MFNQLMDFLHSDIPLKIFSLLVLAATVALPILQENQPWYVKTLLIIMGLGASLGLSAHGAAAAKAKAAANAAVQASQPVAKLLLVAVIASLVFGASARAQTFSTSVGPVLELRLPVAAGGQATTETAVGATETLGFFPVNLDIPFLPGTGKKEYDLLSVGLSVIGGLSQVDGALSLALVLSTLNSLLTLGFGADLLSVGAGATTGLLLLNVSRPNFFAIAKVGVQFDLGTSVPKRDTAGVYHLPRGATIYLGS